METLDASVKDFRELAIEHGHAAAEVIVLGSVWDENLQRWQKRTRPGQGAVAYTQLRAHDTIHA
ncbi:MAG: hypothetical protein ACT6U0_15790, partial [Shinella sp.]